MLQEIERYADSNIIEASSLLRKEAGAPKPWGKPRIINRRSAYDNGRSGPCVVTLPMDIKAAATEDELETGRSEAPFLG